MSTTVKNNLLYNDVQFNDKNNLLYNDISLNSKSKSITAKPAMLNEFCR